MSKTNLIMKRRIDKMRQKVDRIRGEVDKDELISMKDVDVNKIYGKSNGQPNNKAPPSLPLPIGSKDPKAPSDIRV